MKKYFIVLIILLGSFTLIHSQNRVTIYGAFGYYLHNSENSLKVIGDKRFGPNFTYGASFRNNDLLGFDFIIDYSYHQITKVDVLQFVRTSSSSPDPIGFFGADLSLASYNIDVDYVLKVNENFICAIGPSFVIVNRTFSIDDTGSPDYNITFDDRLASSGLGANALLEFSIPLNKGEQYFFISAALKLRYTHSIWFDKGIRNLDNYKQEFLTGQFSIGVGYGF